MIGNKACLTAMDRLNASINPKARSVQASPYLISYTSLAFVASFVHLREGLDISRLNVQNGS